MKELVAGTNCTVIGWGKKEDKNCEFVWKEKTFLDIFSAYSALLIKMILQGKFFMGKTSSESFFVSLQFHIERNSISV